MLPVTRWLLVACTPVLALPLAAENLSFGGHNLIVFDDLVIQSTVDGSTLVGGNMSNSGVFQTQIGGAGSSPYALTVGGNITGNHNVNNGGHLLYGGSIAGANINMNGNGSKVADVGGTIPGMVIALQNHLTTGSSYLGALGDLDTTFTTGDGNDLIITSTSNSFGVLNVSGSVFSGLDQIQINLNGPGALVINVSGSSVHVNGGNFVGNALLASTKSRVLWNFHEATSLDTSRAIHGSVLAPFASLHNLASIDGSVAVREADILQAQVHLPTFDAVIAIPEPSMVAATFGVLTLACAGLRRRKARRV